MNNNMNRYTAIAALLASSALAGCGDKVVRNISGPPPASSNVRFFNFGLNAPSVNFYADATKMTAILASTGVESTNGIAYGGVGAGGAYSAIAPGQHTLTGKIAASTDKDLVVASLAANIADGKYYSFYMSGPYDATAKQSDSFIIEDDFSPPADLANNVKLRFVNAIYNANPMTLYAKNGDTGVETAIGGEVAYKSGGAFVEIPFGTYDLSTRYTGSSTNAITRTGVAFTAGRVYTITARGDITVTSSTATNRPFLDNTANR